MGAHMFRDGSNITVHYEDKTVIGLTERIKMKGPKGTRREVVARIDTGATMSSVDVALAADLKLGPVIRSKTVKSASGTTLRAIVQAAMEMADREFTAEFSLADRKHLTYDVLIGQNILKNNKFIIDPNKQE